MNPLNFGEELDKFRSAAREALQTTSATVGVPLINRAEHIQALRNMSQGDLDALADEYGVDQVVHYLRRLSGG